MCTWGVPVYRDEAAANRIALATIAFGDYSWREVLSLAGRARKEAKSVGDVRHVIAAERLIAAALDDLARYDEAWKSAYQMNLIRSYRMRRRIFDDDRAVRRTARLVRLASPLIGRFPGLVLRFWWGRQAKVIEQVSRL